MAVALQFSLAWLWFIVRDNHATGIFTAIACCERRVPFYWRIAALLLSTAVTVYWTAVSSATEAAYCDMNKSTYDPSACGPYHNPWIMRASRAFTQWVLADIVIVCARLLERKRLRVIKGSCCYSFLNIWVRVVALVVPASLMVCVIVATVKIYNEGFTMRTSTTWDVTSQRAGNSFTEHGSYNSTMAHKGSSWGSASEKFKPPHALDPWAIGSSIILGWVFKFGISSIMYVWLQIRPCGEQEHLQDFNDVQSYFSNADASVMPCGLCEGAKKQGPGRNCTRGCELGPPGHWDPPPTHNAPSLGPPQWHGQYSYPPQPQLPPHYR